MAARKYYLDDQGLIKVLQNVSNKINQKTTSRFTFTETQDPVTGEITRELNNPSNFATVGAVQDYVVNQSRKNLTINKQSAVDSEDEEQEYNVQNNISEYNGNEAAQIDFNLIEYTDIRKLFI